MEDVIGKITDIFAVCSEQQKQEVKEFYIKLITKDSCESLNQKESSSAPSAWPVLIEGM